MTQCFWPRLHYMHMFQPFPFVHYDLLEQCLPLYNILRRNVRKSSCLLKSPLPRPNLPVPANEKLLAWVGDELLPRDSAKVLLHVKWYAVKKSKLELYANFCFWFLTCNVYKVSVFNSVVQGGDSVWEGLRVYSGKIFKLDEHLHRSVKGQI